MASSSRNTEEDMHEERTDGNPNTVNSWSDLPTDLLSIIADRLDLIELLSFRGVCKEWRMASSAASAEIQLRKLPWFLCVDPEDRCTLYTPHFQESFKIIVPDLYGARCLASDQGWLLVFKQGSAFFLCPFSGAKIDLPDFPCEEVEYHVAAFSAPPTSPDCMVCVINRRDYIVLEMYTVRRGENTWNKYKGYNFHWRLLQITFAVYSEGLFFFSDSQNALLTFSDAEKSWKSHSIILGPRNERISRLALPFMPIKDYSKKKDLRRKLKIEDNASMWICGTRVQLPNHPGYFLEGEEVLPLEYPQGKDYQGIWVQPRFMQSAHNQNWSL